MAVPDRVLVAEHLDRQPMSFDCLVCEGECEFTAPNDYHLPCDEGFIAPGHREGDPRFLKILDEIERLHAVKQRDYGTTEDPFANVRASQDWGIAPWVGALIRATDKVKRLQTFNRKGTLANEGVEDSLLDLAVYSIISLVLFRETE